MVNWDNNLRCSSNNCSNNWLRKHMENTIRSPTKVFTASKKTLTTNYKSIYLSTYTTEIRNIKAMTFVSFMAFAFHVHVSEWFNGLQWTENQAQIELVDFPLCFAEQSNNNSIAPGFQQANKWTVSKQNVENTENTKPWNSTIKWPICLARETWEIYVMYEGTFPPWQHRIATLLSMGLDFI